MPFLGPGEAARATDGDGRLPPPMGLAKLCCLYPCGVIAVVVAVLIAFFSMHEIPEGRMFATMIPLAGGYFPATIVGEAWWEAHTPVPAVASDLKPAARPASELMLPLIGGGEMPALGLGLCCRATAYDATSVSRSVLWFLLKGGRHIDTAFLYLNHAAVGKGIAQAIARGIPRKEIFVTTKIPTRFYSGDAIETLVPRFLEELGLEYIDLLLLHLPEGFGPFGRCANGTAVECRAHAWTTRAKQPSARARRKRAPSARSSSPSRSASVTEANGLWIAKPGLFCRLRLGCPRAWCLSKAS